MKYLSFDLEATGLEQDCLMIEFAMIPFCSQTLTIEHNLAYETLIQCPSFEELSPTLNPWVRENNKDIITKAHNQGLSLEEFKRSLEKKLTSQEYQTYFNQEKIVLFGKSMSAIDLPFLNRDLGWDFMRKYFVHRQLDFSSICYGLADMNLLKPGDESGSVLMEKLGMGEVKHTALEDAINTAKMYLELLSRHNQRKSQPLI